MLFALKLCVDVLSSQLSALANESLPPSQISLGDSRSCTFFPSLLFLTPSNPSSRTDRLPLHRRQLPRRPVCRLCVVGRGAGSGQLGGDAGSGDGRGRGEEGGGTGVGVTLAAVERPAAKACCKHTFDRAQGGKGEKRGCEKGEENRPDVSFLPSRISSPPQLPFPSPKPPDTPTAVRMDEHYDLVRPIPVQRAL